MRAILTYHSLDDSGSAISVSPRVFRQQVGWLAGSGVRIVSLADLLSVPEGDDAVALTFDDGFANLETVAAPLLAELGLPATVFVVSDAVGTTNRWRAGLDRGVPELPLLSWDALGRLRAGTLDVGAHTRTHPDLARVPQAVAADEIVGSRERIARELGHTPTAFAYPYGATTPEVTAVVAAHFTHGCTTEMRWLRVGESAERLPRVDMYYLRSPGRLERWGTARFDYYVRLRASARLVRRRLESWGHAW